MVMEVISERLDVRNGLLPSLWGKVSGKEDYTVSGGNRRHVTISNLPKVT